MHPRIPLAFLAARVLQLGSCWLMVNLLSTRTPRSLSTQLLLHKLQQRGKFCVAQNSQLKSSELLQTSRPTAGSSAKMFLVESHQPLELNRDYAVFPNNLSDFFRGILNYSGVLLLMRGIYNFFLYSFFLAQNLCFYKSTPVSHRRAELQNVFQRDLYLAQKHIQETRYSGAMRDTFQRRTKLIKTRCVWMLISKSKFSYLPASLEKLNQEYVLPSQATTETRNIKLNTNIPIVT